MTNSWPECFDRLVTIARYPDDWNGEGSPAVERPIIYAVLMLANDLLLLGAPPPRAVRPGVNGTIIFEWHRGSDYHEIEVEAPGVWMLWRSGP
jgi:hypothetical protein